MCDIHYLRIEERKQKKSCLHYRKSFNVLLKLNKDISLKANSLCIYFCKSEASENSIHPLLFLRHYRLVLIKRLSGNLDSDASDDGFSCSTLTNKKDEANQCALVSHEIFQKSLHKRKWNRKKAYAADSIETSPVKMQHTHSHTDKCSQAVF